MRLNLFTFRWPVHTWTSLQILSKNNYSCALCTSKVTAWTTFTYKYKIKIEFDKSFFLHERVYHRCYMFHHFFWEFGFSCLTRERAIYDLYVDKSCHPTGPLSQSAHARYFTFSTVCETPMFSKQLMSSTIQQSVIISRLVPSLPFLHKISGRENWNVNKININVVL